MVEKTNTEKYLEALVEAYEGLVAGLASRMPMAISQGYERVEAIKKTKPEDYVPSESTGDFLHYVRQRLVGLAGEIEGYGNR